ASLKASHTYTIAGVYNVKLLLRFKNGTHTCYTLTTKVEALLIPKLSLTIAPEKITFPKTECTATVITKNTDSLVIDWADGTTDNFNTNVGLVIKTHDYPDTGHYLVTATAYNKNT